MTKSIPLTQGKFALVDDEDFEWLNSFKWSFHKHGYAFRRRLRSEKPGSQFITMHRFVNQTPEGLVTDHINGKGLDNRRSNLRSCTHIENTQGKSISIDNQTGYKGVSLRSSGRFSASLETKDKNRYLGTFDTAREAAMAYNKAAKKLFGKFARLNPIGE